MGGFAAAAVFDLAEPPREIRNPYRGHDTSDRNSTGLRACTAIFAGDMVGMLDVDASDTGAPGRLALEIAYCGCDDDDDLSKLGG